jgi:hypothetical protein
MGEDDWLPDGACTLPVVERPLRVAEFDRVFAESLRGQERRSPTVLRWLIDPAAGDAVRELAAWEASCCSFFVFRVGAGTVDVEVPPAYVHVLDALAQRAERAR